MNMDPHDVVRELEVLEILSFRPDGMTLMEIGNEMGVNWRSLAHAIKVLMDEGSVEKVENIYCLTGSKAHDIKRSALSRPLGTGVTEEQQRRTGPRI